MFCSNISRSINCCLKSGNSLLCKSTSRNMTSFQAEKQKYLSMSFEDKRKVHNKKTVSIDQIEPWSKYVESNKINVESSDAKVDLDLVNKVSIWEGDITTLEIDAIVNAANSSLLGGGGVDGAIHRGAGKLLKEECATLNGCNVGEAKITGAYMLPCKYVIHTVGPQGEKPDKLKSCYESCLNLAKENGIRTIAFPCISTGIYGYPQKPAANVALSTVQEFVKENPSSVDRVIFCIFLKTDKDIYEELMQKYFPPK